MCQHGYGEMDPALRRKLLQKMAQEERDKEYQKRMSNRTQSLKNYPRRFLQQGYLIFYFKSKFKVNLRFFKVYE